MGQLYNRNKIHVLEHVMLRNIHNFVAVLGQKTTCFEAGSACRALEADIICMLWSVVGFGPNANSYSGLLIWPAYSSLGSLERWTQYCHGTKE